MITLTIDGVSYEDLLVAGTLTLEEQAHQVLANFTLQDFDQSARPDVLTEVIIAENGTRIFGGVLWGFTETDIEDVENGSYYEIECRDFNELLERRLVFHTFAAGTTVGTLVHYLRDNYLVDYGVTVAASQATGPTLPEIVCDGVTPASVIEKVALITNWQKKFTFFKELSLQAPSIEAFPVSLTEANANVLREPETEISVKDYRNVQIVRIGGTSQTEVTEIITSSGTQRIYYPTEGFNVLYYPFSRPGSLIENKGGVVTTQPVGVYGVDSSPWLYVDPNAASIPPGWPANQWGFYHNDSYPLLANGDTITFTALVTFPVYVSAELPHAAEDEIERFYDAPDVVDWRTGLSLADALLRRYGSTPLLLIVQTLVDGFHPLQVGTVNLPQRGAVGTFMVESVERKPSGASPTSPQWFYTIHLVEGDERTMSLREEWSELLSRLADVDVCRTTSCEMR